MFSKNMTENLIGLEKCNKMLSFLYIIKLNVEIWKKTHYLLTFRRIILCQIRSGLALHPLLLQTTPKMMGKLKSIKL